MLSRVPMIGVTFWTACTSQRTSFTLTTRPTLRRSFLTSMASLKPQRATFSRVKVGRSAIWSANRKLWTESQTMPKQVLYLLAKWIFSRKLVKIRTHEIFFNSKIWAKSKTPVMAFVRLSEARDMGEVVSVPLPVRFIFILLGPEDVTMDYHEIGRAISTLMSNHDFHNR